jgi:hypothetical protein
VHTEGSDGRAGHRVPDFPSPGGGWVAGSALPRSGHRKNARGLEDADRFI